MQLAGNRLCFLCKSKPPHTHFNHKAVTGGCDSITSPLLDFIKAVQHSLPKKINDWRSRLAAAGDAIDRLEGDGIKTERASHTASLQRWQKHGSGTKNNLRWQCWRRHYFLCPGAVLAI